ncbi:hypothetical protein C4D60_Mb07t11970 [Musa balbisiana]|uniref:Uncharacterized protein n=1 Tax=Musa balbisiana TaxID=52838 RepID=A0A4S8JEX8_MUSBA|nr:hypothetical protein C4D60_Mb07t11970 [Musa balbisiana]
MAEEQRRCSGEEEEGGRSTSSFSSSVTEKGKRISGGTERYDRRSLFPLHRRREGVDSHQFRYLVSFFFAEGNETLSSLRPAFFFHCGTEVRKDEERC